MAGHGTISENDLMKKLVSARKIMNKVDEGSYESGHVDREILGKSQEELMESTNLPNNPGRPVGNVDASKVNRTNLPDNIKRAMIENPIPQISLNDTLDMDFVKGAKRLMEQEGLSTGNNRSQKTQQKPSSQSNVNSSDLINTLTPIIENIIRKTLDEIVDKKLMQILTAQHTVSINENLAIKVGDSIFTGKITKVNKSK